MPELKLYTTSPLGGYCRDFDGLCLAEKTSMSIVSIATPSGGADRLKKTVKKLWKANLPAVGKFAPADFHKARLLGLQQGQYFLLFEHEEPDARKLVAEQLQDTAYTTDQSDSFVLLELRGKNCRAALERICMLDLNPESFPQGSVARTSMEHLGVIILCQQPDDYLLMSARSSARSFLHALVTSIENIS